MGLLDKLGVGGGKLSIAPAALQVHAGTAITGQIIYIGGKRLQPITKISVRVQCTLAERGQDGQMHLRTVDICPDQIVSQAFSAQPGQQHPFAFSFTLPTGIPASRPSETTYRVVASADIPGEVDPGADVEITLLASGATAAPVAAAQQGWAKISKDGEWQNSRAMVAVGGVLYLSHSNGKVYAIKPNGTYAQLGDSSGWNTRLMAATLMTRTLWLVEQSGKLFQMELPSGAWGEPGNNQEWGAVTSVTGLGSSLFASTPGKLWSFDPSSGWRQLGALDTWRTRFLFGGTELIAVEESGDVFAVRPEDGAYRNIGNPSQWGTIVTATCDGPLVYVNMSNGGLYGLDTTSGRWFQVGTSMGWNSFALASSGSLLFSLERNGTLFVVQGGAAH